ncbi:MAG: helix-turn-helix transcriptional regulator [Oscillospiraceae bacterium]|nr:helix-turn-helix transcriptional regulator [Oscillospiraceae bacterium]
MDKKTIGKIISTQRAKKGMSLTELSSGICNKSTLMRIEAGEVNTSTDTLSGLLERLGIHVDFDEASNFDDILVRQIIRSANQADVTGNRTEALELLNTIASDYDSFSLQNKQRYDVINIMLLHEDRKITDQTRLHYLEKSMRLTQPKYSLENLPLVMTDMEAQILRYIAATYGIMGNYDTAIVIYYHLRNYIKQDVDKIDSSKKLVNVCYNLSKCLGQSGRYSEGVEIAKEGIDACRFTNNVYMLPLCMYNYAWSLAYRDEAGDWDEARKLMTEISAYCTPMTRDIDALKKNIRELKIKLGIQ